MEPVENFIEVMYGLGIVLALFVASVPIHELGHVLCIRILGEKIVKIEWLGMSRCKIRGFVLYQRPENDLCEYVIAFAGGIFASVIYAIVGFGCLYFLTTLRQYLLMITILTCLVIAICQIIDGILEGISAIKVIKTPGINRPEF